MPSTRDINSRAGNTPRNTSVANLPSVSLCRKIELAKNSCNVLKRPYMYKVFSAGQEDLSIDKSAFQYREKYFQKLIKKAYFQISNNLFK